MKHILLSLLLLCSLGISAQTTVVTRQKKQQTTTVDKRKAEQEAARKHAEAKRREQARQEQLRKEQEERDRQARVERERQEQARKQHEAEEQARKQHEAEEQARLKAEAEAREKAKELVRLLDELARNLVYVQGGTFRMGATSEQGSDPYYSDEKPVHKVTLSSYYIGKYEVTQDLWQAVMGSNPSYFKGSRKPVECVSWWDCQTFISKLNSLTGKRFRLPTEAEWEFASRGGTMSRGYKYSGSNTLSNVAWYIDNSGLSSTTHDVGTKSPNELGLYDMSGNVEEWCSDWYAYYSSSSQTNPTGPSSGSRRVTRGDSWASDARFCRSSHRSSYAPDSSSTGIGLRLVLVP